MVWEIIRLFVSAYVTAGFAKTYTPIGTVVLLTSAFFSITFSQNVCPKRIKVASGLAGLYIFSIQCSYKTKFHLKIHCYILLGQLNKDLYSDWKCNELTL